MSKRLTSLMCFVLMLGFAGGAFGAGVWSASPADNLWSNSANWDAVPGAGDAVHFYYHPTGAQVVIDSGTAAECATLDGLGWYSGQQGKLTVQTGGSLDVGTGLVLGQGTATASATLDIDGGIVNVLGSGVYLYVGHDTTGALNVTSGGALNVETLYVTVAGGSGHIQLDDGLITVHNWMSMNAYGTMDIGANGKLVIPWVDLDWMTSKYQGLIDNGQITGTGALNAYVGYEEGVGGTLSTVVPEPVTIAMLGLGGLALIRRKRS